MRLVKLALLVALVPAVPVAAAHAQGPPLPEGVVARVGDELIPKSDVDTWYAVFAGETKWLATDPPDYERCVATLDKRASARGRNPTRLSLRRRCRARAESIRELAMWISVQEVWVRQEAARVGVVVTLPEIARRVARYKRTFSAEDRRTLARLTDAQVASLVAYSMLFERLVERVLAKLPEVTPERVRRYYAHHPRKYRHVPRERALRRIEARLNELRELRASIRLATNLVDRYAKRTYCAEGYVVEFCGNAKSRGSDETFVLSEPH